MTKERWTTFSKSQQLLMIGSEIMRAKVWQYKDAEKFGAALERGLKLIELCIEDKKWQENRAMLVGLQHEFKKFIDQSRSDDILKLYQAL